jgi:hypothetical protein
MGNSRNARRRKFEPIHQEYKLSVTYNPFDTLKANFTLQLPCMKVLRLALRWCRLIAKKNIAFGRVSRYGAIMAAAQKAKFSIGIIGWIAIGLSTLTLLAAGLLVFLIVTTENRQPTSVGGPTDDPRVIAQEADDRFFLDLHKATFRGSSLALEDRAIGEVIGGLKSPDDKISWRLHLKKAGIYEIRFTYSNALEKGAAPGKVCFVCGEEKFVTAIRPTGGVQGTVTDTVFLKLQPVGEVTLELTAIPKDGEEIFALKRVEIWPQLRTRSKG